MMTTTKRCSQCREQKTVSDDRTISEFWRHASSPDGFAYACKACNREMRRRSGHAPMSAPPKRRTVDTRTEEQIIETQDDRDRKATERALRELTRNRLRAQVAAQ